MFCSFFPIKCTNIQGWDSSDNAWEEHVRWNPSCPFLLMVKGASWISENLPIVDTPMDVSQLERDVGEQQHQQVNRSDSMACRNCSVKQCCVSLPCGHMTVCKDCFDDEENCAKCGQFVLAVIHI
jgi:hypothetical protein